MKKQGCFPQDELEYLGNGVAPFSVIRDFRFSISIFASEACVRK